ncbi:hypothetical protein HCN44_000985 [Aphidius gifuensis]|uniref:Ubiquitin carboxyl-terminal hydrolase 47 n=1 Tax=Aphidius gifuensis TaxID=684658 RepID=A0A835CLM8_APHGI|nr:ubiquitin carboxyl-terminal hydrolase 47 [Aphidius gifuensis]XP_044014452.1 ubiquitin carboxyl-terminal hydrolase 47 [Aphidius gifuensis]KAF7988412.1 hypothetical protein HCN44_000985 [Aphidius gifuensis]
MVVEASDESLDPIDNYQIIPSLSGANSYSNSIITVLVKDIATVPVRVLTKKCLVSLECEVSLICQLISWLQKENRPVSDCKICLNNTDLYYSSGKKLADYNLNIDTNKQSKLGIAYKFCDDVNEQPLFKSPKFIELKVSDKTNGLIAFTLPYKFIITPESTIDELTNNILNLSYTELLEKYQATSHIILKFRHSSTIINDDNKIPNNEKFKNLKFNFYSKKNEFIEIINIQIINKTTNTIIDNEKSIKSFDNNDVIKKFYDDEFDQCIESVKNGCASEYPIPIDEYNTTTTTKNDNKQWSSNDYTVTLNNTNYDVDSDSLFDKIEEIKTIGQNNYDDTNNTTNNYHNDKTINNINNNNNSNNNNNDDYINNNNNNSSNIYVGLVNQAMTCYLNSLLQALYMTPEFRNALYNWEYIDGPEKDEAKSIPYQLQKLFLNLQTSDKNSVKTTSLTKSFGWDSTDAWHQHDIQELCRVMFDALEQKFKNTKQSDLINRLYEGKMIDYVKCLECKTIKSREDTFLDIPLPVRPFGCNVAYNDVQEALRAFVQPETLDGVNQYNCEKCNKKTDAHKGLKFKKFPYLLTLHLKRFDFDYNTFQRIKLNDKVSFPDKLNLNSFVIDDNSDTQELIINEEDAGVGVKCDEPSTSDLNNIDELLTTPTTKTITSSSVLTTTTPPPSPPSSPVTIPQPPTITTTTTTNNEQDDDEGIDMSNGPSTSSTHSQDNDRCHVKGPYNYELYAIMIHSGSASGGHYYAYIKDFKTNEWLCFNDQEVTSITQNDIQKTFGGGPTRTFYSGYYGSSINAYMLMYRQIDSERNAVPMTVDNFPPHIKELLKKIKIEEQDNKLFYDRPKPSLCSARVSVVHPIDNTLKMKKMYFFENETLKGSVERVYKEFNLDNIVDIEQCRLVSWDSKKEYIKRSYDEPDDDKISEILESDAVGGNNKNGYHEMLLEIRDKNEKFKYYSPDAFKTTIYIVDNEKYDIIDGPFHGRALFNVKIGEFKKDLADEYSMDIDNMICAVILKTHFDSVKILEDDKDDLRDQGFIYDLHGKIILMQNDNNKHQLDINKLAKLATDIDNTIYLKINLPDMSKEKLDEMNIKLIDEHKNHDDEYNYYFNNSKKCIDSGDNNSCNNIINNNKDTNGSVVAGGTTTTTTTTTATATNEIDELQEQSNSEDSSQSDSDRTLVGKLSENDDDDDDDGDDDDSTDNQYSNKEKNFEKELLNIELKKYFKVIKKVNDKNGNTYLKLFVDRRLKIHVFKLQIEKYLGISNNSFKFDAEDNDYINDINYSHKYDDDRIYSKIDNNSIINIVLLRILGINEIKIKLHQLYLNTTSSTDSNFQLLFDIIVTKDMTIKQLKNTIVNDMKSKMNTDITVDKIRLRKKIHQIPSKVYFNHQVLSDICLNSPIDIIFQELDGFEQVTNDKQVLVIVKCYSGVEYGQQYQEIVLSSPQATIEELTEKVAELSSISPENLEFTKGRWPMGQRNRQLEWTSIAIGNDIPELYDGAVIYYRDTAEKSKQPFIKTKREIADSTETARDNRNSSASTYRRREHPLRIYVNDRE